MRNKLTIRDYRLYDFLLSVGDKWVLQMDIPRALPDVFPYSESEGDFHNSACRHAITKSIRAINNSDEIQKVIISSGKGVKIANEAEWEMYIKSEYKSVFSKLKRVRRKEKKGLLNGQKRLVFDSDKDIIEAFIKEA